MPGLSGLVLTAMRSTKFMRLRFHRGAW